MVKVMGTPAVIVVYSPGSSGFPTGSYESAGKPSSAGPVESVTVVEVASVATVVGGATVVFGTEVEVVSSAVPPPVVPHAVNKASTTRKRLAALLSSRSIPTCICASDERLDSKNVIVDLPVSFG
jgi:hypothetical protein